MEGWGTQAGWRSGHGRTEGKRTIGQLSLRAGSKPKTEEQRMGRPEDRQNQEPVDRGLVEEQRIVCIR